jgi:hypothetical protein
MDTAGPQPPSTAADSAPALPPVPFYADPYSEFAGSGLLDTTASGPSGGVAAGTADPPRGVDARLPKGETIVDLKSPTGSVLQPAQAPDLSAVAAAGRQTAQTFRDLSSNGDTAGGALPYFVGSLWGHGGVFDYQREGNHSTGFKQLPQYRPISNVNVGLFSQQTGMSLEDTLSAAGAYAYLRSSNYRPDEPHGLDPETAYFIRMEYHLGESGMFDPPPGS